MAEAIDRAADTRDEIVARVRAAAGELHQLGVTAFWLFGSAARDELGDDSDVDIFVDYDPASDFSLITLVRLERLLSARLGRPVDLTTKDGLHPMLREQVERTSLKVL